MRTSLALSCLLLALSGCDDPGVLLVVDVKTDYLPGRQFVGIRTEVGDPELATVSEREDAFVSSTGDYLEGERVAEIADLDPGTVAVRVSLLDPMGEAIATRTTLVSLSGQHALTVLITSSCEGVSCPGPADDPSFSACVGGRCVDPRCSVENPELCGDPECTSDAQCSSPVACADAVCIDGACFIRVDDSRCEASEQCHPREDCVLRDDVDAGPGCPPTETSCVDGIDDDCDGMEDCADPDCTGVSCDDGSACTQNDACAAGACTGEAIVCDDADPCTDDSCDPAMGCATTPSTASCDNGFWCDGPDRCAVGVCAAEGPAPCATFCNESTMACEECQMDSDCGTVSYGTWSACSGFGGTCGESGTQSRSVMTPSCASGMCTILTTSESRSCSRNTDGDSCGTTTYSSWGSCGGFSNACDETGTQSRTRTERRCSSGSCTNRNSTENRSCSRSRPNGTSCGGTWMRCCGGACRDLRNNANCGGCGVNCNSIGLNCASTGTGGYSCRGCSSNAQCRSILNSNATCYNISSPPAWCQCQCASTGVCANGGCGTNMFCHSCPGTNFCAPFGGSC